MYIHILLLRLTAVFYWKVRCCASLFSLFLFSAELYSQHPASCSTENTNNVGPTNNPSQRSPGSKTSFFQSQAENPHTSRAYLVCGLSPLQEIGIEILNEPGHAVVYTTLALVPQYCDGHRNHFPPAPGYKSSETCEVGQWHISMFTSHPRKFCSIASQFP